MTMFRRKATEQEIKGTAQKAKGVAQEIVGRVSGDSDMRARGEVNQVGGHLRSRAGEVGRKISAGYEDDAPRPRRRR
jgi:uncharacterized protein YjbJ (UPF0337 family)